MTRRLALAALALSLLLPAAARPVSTVPERKADDVDAPDAEATSPPDPAGTPVRHAGLAAALEAAGRDGALVLVVFGATWCEPCRRLERDVLQSAGFDARAGRLHVVPLDVDAQPRLAERFRIRAVPTLLLLTDAATVVARRPGAPDLDALLEWIQAGRTRRARGEWEGAAGDPEVDALLARFREANELAEVVRLLGHRDPAARGRAAALLEGEREAAVEPLLDGMAHPYLGVRVGAAEVWRRLAPGAPRPDPWAGPEARAEALAAVRAWWTEAGELPPPPAAVEADPAELRTARSAIEQVLGGDPIRRTRGMTLLKRMGAEALPAIEAALAEAAERDDRAALAALGDVRWAILVPEGLEAEARVRHDLARGDVEARQAAAERLGAGKTQALPALRALLDAPEPLVREAAVRALRTVGNAEAVEAMATLLEAEDANLRMTAAQALGATRKKAAGPHLAGAVRDPDEVVAITAIAALEEVKATAQGDALVAALEDERWRVRAAAAEAVGDLGVQAGRAPLVRLLEDEDAFVVRKALDALIGMEHTVEAEKLVALTQRLPSLIGAVAKHLADKDNAGSLATAKRVYEAAEPAGRLALLEAIAAERHYGSNSDAHWRPLLETAMEESDAKLRRAALRVIARRSEYLAGLLLTPLLSDEDAEVRRAAADEVLRVAACHYGVAGHTASPVHGALLAENAEKPAGGDGDEEDADGLFAPMTRIVGAVAGDGQSDRASRIRFVRNAHVCWRASLEKMLPDAGAPSLAVALAYCATGDPGSALPVVERAFEAEDAAEQVPDLANGDPERAAALFLKRLPWPDGRAALQTGAAIPALYVQFLQRAGAAPEAARAMLLEPERVVGMLTRSAEPDPQAAGALVHVFLAKPEDSRVSFRRADWKSRPLIEALLASPHPLARAVGAWGISRIPGLEEEERDARLARLLDDEDPWVRRAALRIVAGLPSIADREALAGPLLSDKDPHVVEMAAVAIIEPNLRAAADLENLPKRFRFGTLGFYVHSRSSYSVSHARPVRALRRSPDFLAAVADRLAAFADGDGATKEEKARDGVAAPEHLETALTLLLGQYGDGRGFEVRLAAWKRTGGVPSDALLLALPLTRDAKFLPVLRAKIAKTEHSWRLRRLLRHLRGVRGEEAREIRRLINRRIRRSR